MARGSESRATAGAPARQEQPRPVVRHLTGSFPAEWEEMKGRCRNLRPHDAVMECAWLSDLYRRRHRKMSPVQPDFRRIIAALQTKKIPFVLTGAYGISTWTGRPRSTHDVDILVKGGRNQARAVNALKALYPEFEVRSLTGVTAFFVPGERESVIDVTYPHRADIEVTLQSELWIEDAGLRYRIPTLEAALANKYGAMLTLTRDPLKKAMDAVDFGHMVRHSLDEGREPIDLEALAVLGEKVWPGGGGQEILRLVEQVKAGQVPTVAPPQ
jgi:hypothetical protein